MDDAKRKRLEGKGWHTGTAAEFLGLSPEEDSLIALEVDASRFIRERRKALGLTQADVASRIGSTQSRIAKLEKVEKGASLDLYIRAVFALGGRVDVVAASEGPSVVEEKAPPKPKAKPAGGSQGGKPAPPRARRATAKAK